MKKILSLVIIFVLFLTGCQGGSEQTFVVPVSIEPSSLSPLEDVSAGAKAVLRNLNASLLKYNTTTGQLENDLASNITNTDNNFTIELQSDLKFSDASALTSEDIVYSFERLAGMVDGFDGVDSSWVELMENYNYNIVSDTTLEISFNEESYEELKSSINYLFLDAFIVPSDVTEETQDTSPVGAGAYKFDSYTPGQNVMMSYNENYQGEKPDVTSVEFRVMPDESSTLLAFQSNEINYLPLTTENYEAVNSMSDVKVVDSNANDIRVIHMNMRTEPFNNLEIRQAFNMAIDKNRIIENNTISGQEVGSHMSPAMPNFFDESLVGEYAYDVDAAKELMEKNGYNEDNRLQITYNVVAENDISNAMAVYVKEDLSEIYVDVEVLPVPWDQYYNDIYTGKNFELADIQIVGYPDPYDVMSRYKSDTNGNLPGLDSQEYDDLLKAARAETDVEVQEEYFKELQAILVENATSIFVMDSGTSIALSGDYSNIETYPFAYIDIASIKIEK